MPISARFSYPRTIFIGWFIQRNEHLNAATQLKLLAGPFSSGAALIAGGLNTLLISGAALYRQPTKIFIAWLCINLLIWTLRWAHFYRCNALSKPPAPYATDMALLLGLICAAQIGVGTAACVISGDPVLQVLACTSAIGMNGAIAMRSQGIPRYALVQILLTDIPLKMSTLFQPEPMLRVLILQAPLYFWGLWTLVWHLNETLINAYESEAKSSHSAAHDSLTGLLNRFGILIALSKLLKSPCQRHYGVAVLYLDLDGFKAVNDRYGHSGGDNALIVFSKLLSSVIRNSDFAARIGGDEFIVVLRQSSETSASRTAERIIQSLENYCRTSDNFAGLSVSVGIALGESNSVHTTESLLYRADVALYKAKMAGKNCYRYM